MACDGSKRGFWTWLGRVDYGAAMEVMNRVAADVQRGGSGALLLLEHPPVLTLGHREDGKNLRAGQEELASMGISVHRTDRGGLVTYHGPGQLVGYLVFRLTDLAPTVGDLVRRLELLLARLAAEYGVEAAPVDGLPGLWVGGTKLAAIGLRIRKGVTAHGFSFNLSPNLSHFDLIVPCGIPGAGAVSIESVAGRSPRIDTAARRAAELFQEAFDMVLLETDVEGLFEEGAA